MYDKKKIGTRLRQLRKERGYSQDEMAEKCYIRSRQTYAKWENGDLNMSVEDLITLCNIFDCDIGYLLCEYDTKRHVVADVREQTGLSEEAITVLQKLGQFCTSILSALLVQPSIDQWFFSIHRIALDLSTFYALKKEMDEAVANAENPKISTIPELVIKRKIMPEIESAELQEQKRHNELLSNIFSYFCKTEELQKAGAYSANVEIEVYKAENSKSK